MGNTQKVLRRCFKTALKESFGKKGMNTMERKTENTYTLADGFYMTDNIVHVIFKDLCLTELPHLKTPKVTFQLAHNVLQVEAELGKMIVETKYNLMRNSSDVTFTGPAQDPYESSPFVFQQVLIKGNAAIIADGCSINGFTVSTLSGQTIVLGHDTFRVSNCQFNIEISSAGSGSPPVIAPYFSKEQRIQLENIINKPIRMEMITKLQSYIFTFLNTSIFDQDLIKYRNSQEKIFKTTRKYIDEIVRNTNKQTVIENKASEDVAPLEILRIGNNRSKTKKELVILSDIVVDGFDSAYSPHIGGPYKLKTVGIAETLRYNTLKIRGQLTSQHDNVRKPCSFFMELQDVSVNLEMNLENESQGKFNTDTNINWRNTDFSVINISQVSDMITAESIISGYLINEVPKSLTLRLLKLTDSDVNTSTEKSINETVENNRDNQASNGSDSLPKQEDVVESSPRNEKKLHVQVNLKKTNSFNVMLKRVQGVQSSDNERDTKVKKNIFVKNILSTEENDEQELKAYSSIDIDNRDEDVLTSSKEEDRRRHKKKNTKHKRHGKHHNNHHRGKTGINNRHNKKILI